MVDNIDHEWVQVGTGQRGDPHRWQCKHCKAEQGLINNFARQCNRPVVAEVANADK